MKNETDLRHWLSDALGKHGHFQPVENAINPGVFDCNFLYQGVEFWIELKTCPEIKSAGKNFPLSLLSCQKKIRLIHPVLNSQKIWAFSRLMNGGKVLLCIGVLGGRPAFLFKKLSNEFQTGNPSQLMLFFERLNAGDVSVDEIAIEAVIGDKEKAILPFQIWRD